jgi:hypothetical protein
MVAIMSPRRVEVNSVAFSDSSLPMKVELAVNRMPCDEGSLQQKKDSLLKERSDLLAMQVALIRQENASLLAQQQAQTQFIQRSPPPGVFVAPISPAFRPPPGLSFPMQSEIHVADACQKQRMNASCDDYSDRASTCSGSAESCEVISESDSTGTTVIMRNIPNRFSQAVLTAVLDKQGFSGAYDLIYVPVDFATGVSFGYAFVNLISVEEAERFVASFDGFKWGGASKKVCSVALCDDNESPSERVERYRNLPVMHPSVPESFKPAMYSGGQCVPFPAPTKRLRAPRIQCPGKKE